MKFGKYNRGPSDSLEQNHNRNKTKSAVHAAQIVAARTLYPDVFKKYWGVRSTGGFRRNIWLKPEVGGTQKQIDEIIAEAKTQSSTAGVESSCEYIFGYKTREAENYVPPVLIDGNDSNVPTIERKGSGPTTVVLQHELDEVILYRIFGGKKEEDHRDFTDTTKHIVREHKPRLSKEIVADALGKLVQGQNSYKRRYGIKPALEFITRVKVDREVLEDIHTIGAKAFQLTKTNQLVEMA